MRIRQVLALGTGLLAAALSASSCHRAAPPPVTAAAGSSLYHRLGGAPRLGAVVDQFVVVLTVDSRVGRFFADTDLPQFRASLTRLLGQLAGGPERYSGRNMKSTHGGFGISDADFDAVIDDFGKACDATAVGVAERADLLALLQALRGDIVGQ